MREKSKEIPSIYDTLILGQLREQDGGKGPKRGTTDCTDDGLVIYSIFIYVLSASADTTYRLSYNEVQLCFKFLYFYFGKF